jgi:hypothetical protein
MQLEGSCHCGKVRFSVEAYAPVPFLRCYCSICRKTQGGGGFAINLGAWKKSLKLEGKKHLSVYRALGVLRGQPKKRSSGRRHFCKHCGAALWLWDPSWPELVHPFASAIDTALPKAPDHVDILLDSKADWVPLPPKKKGDKRYDHYPEESLADWHARHGWDVAPPKRKAKRKTRPQRKTKPQRKA